MVHTGKQPNRQNKMLVMHISANQGYDETLLHVQYSVLYCDCAVLVTKCVLHQNLLVSVGKNG